VRPEQAAALGLRPEQARARAEEVLELRPEQALAGRAELPPDQAGTPKQLIARMVKRHLRPALGTWFGIPRIKDAWPDTAGCDLAPELTEIRVCARQRRSQTKSCCRTVAALRGASGSAPVGDVAASNFRALPGQHLALGAFADMAEGDFVPHRISAPQRPVDSSHANSWRMHERRSPHR
jgi:hypothetical protein